MVGNRASIKGQNRKSSISVAHKLDFLLSCPKSGKRKQQDLFYTNNKVFSYKIFSHIFVIMI